MPLVAAPASRPSEPDRVELLVVVEDLGLILTILEADFKTEVLVEVTDTEKRIGLLVADVPSVEIWSLIEP
jgi:hypothetical protein